MGESVASGEWEESVFHDHSRQGDPPSHILDPR